MTCLFEIMYVKWYHNRGHFIFARSVDGNLDFEIKDGTTLGNIPVYNYADMPRVLDENNQQRLDVFIFRPWPPVSTVNFSTGQVVELKTAN